MSDEQALLVGKIPDRFEDARLKIIADTWGAVPDSLCPKDFLLLIGQTNTILCS